MIKLPAYDQCDTVAFEELKGITLVEIMKHENESLTFVTDDDRKYMMFHWQTCCENVWLEEVIGNLDDLLNTPILLAEEITGNTKDSLEKEGGSFPEETDPEYVESFTWTFYKLATVKGHVTLRWFGESNGYYSEEVDFVKIHEEKKG